MVIFPLEMKKYIPILLAFQILLMSSLSNQGLKSLIKMGSFFQHFAHHIICHQENINIVEFVQLHYSDHEHQKTDHHSHENLPFQNKDHDQQNISSQMPFLLPRLNNIVASKKMKIVSNSLILRSQQLHSSVYSGDIWQPPKV